MCILLFKIVIFLNLFIFIEGYTLWIELPSKVAQGSNEDVETFFNLIRKVASPGNDDEFTVDQIVLRVLDPWAGEHSSTNMNSWIYNPDASEWRGNNNTNPMFDALVEIVRRSNIPVYFLPELHVGDYMKFPCYPNSKVSECSTVEGFIWGDENIPCSDHSVCQIPYFVQGDSQPYANCCGSFELNNNHTLDFSQSACCVSSSTNETICDEEEMKAKGGSFPCVNPLNRVVYVTLQLLLTSQNEHYSYCTQTHTQQSGTYYTNGVYFLSILLVVLFLIWKARDLGTMT